MLSKTRVLLVAVILCSSLIMADFGQVFTYQGKLVDGTGLPAESAVDMTFTLYTASTGGSIVWSETVSGVDPEHGIFSVELDISTGDPTSVDWDAYPELWLQVNVDGTDLSPRERLTSAFHAFNIADGVVTASKLANGTAPGQVYQFDGSDWSLVDGSSIGSNSLQEAYDGGNTIEATVTKSNVAISNSATEAVTPLVVMSDVAGNEGAYFANTDGGNAIKTGGGSNSGNIWMETGNIQMDAGNVTLADGKISATDAIGDPIIYAANTGAGNAVQLSGGNFWMETGNAVISNGQLNVTSNASGVEAIYAVNTDGGNAIVTGVSSATPEDNSGSIWIRNGNMQIDEGQLSIFADSPAGTEKTFNVDSDGNVYLRGDIYAEGATDDANETRLTFVDPTASNVITFPNNSGTVALTSDITSATPGGNDGNIQYKDGTSFAGSDNLHWDAINSRMGIGTATPGYPLHVYGESRMQVADYKYVHFGEDGPLQLLLYDGSTANPKITFASGAGTATIETRDNIGLNLDVRGTSTSSLGFKIRTDNGSGSLTDRLTIMKGATSVNTAFLNTNVGIGTDSPGAKLDVRQTTDNIAGYFVTSSTADYHDGTGLKGEATGATGITRGVVGTNASATSGAAGVYGVSDAAGTYGVFGDSDNGYAGYFQGDMSTTGSINLQDMTAPTAGNKLYANGGNLYWDGTQLNTSGGTSQWTDDDANNRLYNNNATAEADRVYIEDDGDVKVSGGDLEIGEGELRVLCASTSSSLDIGSGGTTTSYGPFYTGWENNKTQMLYTQSEIGGANTITEIGFNISTVGSPDDLVNMEITLMHTSLTELPASYTDMSSGTVVYGPANYTLPSATGWFTVDITDFAYNGSDNLLVQVVWGDNGTYSSSYVVNATTTASYFMVYGYADSETPPFYDGRSYSRPDIRLGLATAGTTQLTVLDGYVQFPEQSTSPTTPASSFGNLYGKADGKVYYKNDAGDEYDLTSGAGEVVLPGGDVEYWIRPTIEPTYIKPYNNDNVRIYDAGEDLAFYYEGSNPNGSFFAGGDCGAIGHRSGVPYAQIPSFIGDEFPFVDIGLDGEITSADDVTYTGLYAYGDIYNGVTGIAYLDVGIRGIGLDDYGGTNSTWPVVGVIGEVVATGDGYDYGQQGVYGWQAATAGTDEYCSGVYGRTSQTGYMSAGVLGQYTASVDDLVYGFDGSASEIWGALGYGGQYGVYGKSENATGAGVVGEASGSCPYGLYSYGDAAIDATSDPTQWFFEGASTGGIRFNGTNMQYSNDGSAWNDISGGSGGGSNDDIFPGESWENGWGDWTPSNETYVTRTTDNAVRGYCANINHPGGGGTYYLTSPTFDLKEAGVIEFDYYYNTEGCCDYVALEAYSGSWSTVWGEHYGSGTGHTSVDLASDVTQVRFKSYGDFSTVYDGLFIDNVRIMASGGGSSNWTLSGSDLYPNLTTYNIGIGRDNPSHKLDVYSDDATAERVARIWNDRDVSGEDGLLVSTTNDASGTYVLNTVSNSASRFYVRADGNIGIGTTGPNSRLDVNGTIRASDFRDSGGNNLLRSSDASISITNDGDGSYDITTSGGGGTPNEPMFMCEGWEDNWSSWTPSNATYVTRTTTNAVSGYCARLTNPGSTSDYYLTSPTFALKDAATLTFSYYYNTETSCDINYCQAYYGAAWNTVWGPYSGTGSGVASVSLPSNTTQIRFWHHGDISVASTGFYIDNVLIGSGGSGDNLGDHTATTDLAMSTNDINFNNSGAGLVWGANYSRIFDNGQLHIETDDNIYFDDNDGPTTRMYINTATGNVGIGTILPGALLDVAGVGRFGSSTNGNVSLGNDGNAYIELRESDGSGTPFIDFSNDASSDYDGRLILSGDNEITVGGAALVADNTYGITLGGVNRTSWPSSGGGYWSSSGSAKWYQQSSDVNDGKAAFRSGSITHGQYTEMSVEVEVPTGLTGTVTFDRKVSSEGGCDYLRFRIDGTDQAVWAGTQAWATVGPYNISAGTHTLTWRYDKDGSVNSGSDCAWVDNLVFNNVIVGSGVEPNLEGGGSGGSSEWTDPGDYVYPADDANQLTKIYETTSLTAPSARVYGRSVSTSTYAHGNLGYYGDPLGLSSNYHTGVYGNSGSGTSNVGVVGRYDASNIGALGGNGIGVYGIGSTWAGLFDGDVNITGNLTLGAYTFPATDGTSGQVLITNGSGTLSWGDAGSGPGPGPCSGDIDIDGSGTSTWSSPLTTWYHDARTTSIYLQSEFGCSGGTITAMKLYVSTIPGQTMNTFTIRMKHSSLSSYSSGAFENSSWTTVYQTNQTISSTGWYTFTFSTPFVYNGTDNIEVDICFNNSSYSSSGSVYYFNGGANRSKYNACDGCAFPTTNPLTWTDTGSLTSNVPRAIFTFGSRSGGGDRYVYVDGSSEAEPIYKNGNAQLENGRADVSFDDSFVSKLNGNAPTVVVTPMGPSNQLYVAEVDATGFSVVENEGTSDVRFNWIAIADEIGSEPMDDSEGSGPMVSTEVTVLKDEFTEDPTQHSFQGWTRLFEEAGSRFMSEDRYNIAVESWRHWIETHESSPE